MQPAPPLSIPDSTAEPPPRHALPSERDGELIEQVAGERPPSPINYRVLVITAVLLGVSVGAIHWLHQRQLLAMAQDFRERGLAARNRGDAEEAIEYLERYLSVAPGDVDAITGLAFSIEESADEMRPRYRALQLFERILQDAPNEFEIRRKLSYLYLEFGRYREARDHLEDLLLRAPGDVELMRLLAGSLENLGLYQEAAATYGRAVVADPTDLDLCRRLVGLIDRRLDDPDRALNVLNELVNRRPHDPEAYLMRGEFRLRQGGIREARIDAIRAYRIAPENPAVCGLLIHLLAEGPWKDKPAANAELRKTLSAALEREPSNPLINLSLAQLDVIEGRFPAAEGRLRSVLDAEPDSEVVLSLLADILILQGRLPEAEACVIDLESRFGKRLYISDLLKGRAAFSREEWPEAARFFQRVFTHNAAPLAMRTRAGLRLAGCWAAMGHLLRRDQILQEVLDLNPECAEAISGLAESYHEAGRLEKAVTLYKRLGSDPAALAAVARIGIEGNRRLPADRQQWDKAERSVNRAAMASPDATQGILLKAELLLAQERDEEAISLLTARRQKDPKNREILGRLLDILAARGDRQAVEAILAETDDTTPGVEEGTIRSRLRLAVARGALDELDSLEPEILRLPDGDREELLRLLAASWLQTGEMQRAAACWSELAEEQPYDLGIKRAQFAIAVLQRDDELARRLVEQMRQIEGSHGEYWQLAEATRLYSLGRAGEVRYFDDARQILVGLERRLPDSTDVKTLLGDLCRAEHDFDGAIEYYSGVINSGVPSRHCVFHLAKILFDRGEFSEVTRLIRRFEQSAPDWVETDLAQLGSAASFQENELGEAVRFAEMSVDPDTPSVRGQIWLGNVHQLAGNSEAAEKYFVRATQLDPAAPAGWVGLVSFLSASNRLDEARDCMARAEKAVRKDLVAMTRAQCYEAIGETRRAAENFDEALRSLDSGWQLVAAVQFYVRTGQSPYAVQILRDVMTRDQVPDQVLLVARRLIAELTASNTTTHPERQASLKLLDANLTDPESGGERQDLILKARVLASSPLQTNRREAIGIFESLDAQQKLDLSDTILWARLCASQQRKRSVQRIAGELVNRAPRNPEVLGLAMRLLLDLGIDDVNVREWLDRLKNIRPDDAETAILAARVAILGGMPEQALQTLMAAKPASSDLAGQADRSRLLQIAVAADEIGSELDARGLLGPAEDFAAYAERCYGELAEVDPSAGLMLVEFLIRRWRFTAGLEACERLQGRVPDSELARSYVKLVQTGQLNEESTGRIADWLTQRSEDSPHSIPLLISRAHVLVLAGQFEAALNTYQLVLDLDPQHVEALNEASLLMALTGIRKESALELIERAIQVTGPLGMLLDTRSTVELALGEPEAAARSAESALDEFPTAVRYFHLAQARAATGDIEDANSALREAFELGLEPGQIHPLERDAYTELRSDLGL